MDALGDVMMLQKMESDKLMALDKLVNPPMNAPTSMKKTGGSIVPGGVNYVDVTQGGQGFTPAYQINPDIGSMAVEIRSVEQRIQSAFFNDLFLSILQEDKRMTATEVAERHDEKLLMLGPVLERLQAELLDVIIDRVFDIMLNLDLFMPPPPEMSGMLLRPEYISTLAQAQKLVGTNAMNNLILTVTNMAQVNPEVVDKVDFDEMTDQYADILGTPPKVIRGDDEVEAIRAQRAQAQQAAVAQAQMDTAIGNAKAMSETPLGQGSVLDSVMEGLG